MFNRLPRFPGGYRGNDGPVPSGPQQGYRTPEFWITWVTTLVTFIISGFVLIGAVPQGEGNYTTYIISNGIESIALVITQMAVIYNYITSRRRAKEDSILITNKLPLGPPKENEPTKTKTRKRRTTKKSMRHNK